MSTLLILRTFPRLVPAKNLSQILQIYPKTIQNINTSRYLSNVPNEPPRTAAQKLKTAVAEYGSTVIVFHVTISLISLGTCYLLISSGVNVNQYLDCIGMSEGVSKIAGNAGTFAVAYGVHKIFAPVRIGITLTATPFIVRYLRRIGLIKHK